MASESVLKLAAIVVCGFVALFYPLTLLVATLTTIYRTLFGQTKSKIIAGDVAVVTGGARGLGKEIAIELAKKGCSIAIVDIIADKAAETATMLSEQYNVKAKAYKVDITNYEDVVALNVNVTNDLGTPTILINNAGFLLFSNRLKPDWREVQTMINVNLTAHFWTNRIFLPKMKELKRGYIVAISSMSSLIPLMYNAEYTSTKYAVRGMMRCMRQELMARKYKDIHALTVMPSFLKTNAEVVKMIQQAQMDKAMCLISGDEAAQCIVRAMLRNDSEIVLPNHLALAYRFLELLPATWQDTILSNIFSGSTSKGGLYEVKK